MDPSSSSVGFPISGNPQPSQNSPPLNPPSGGISSSEGPQATVRLPSSNPLSSTEPYCNEPPTFHIYAKRWNVEMVKLFRDSNFKHYMCGGECQEPFSAWYACMLNVIQLRSGSWSNCSDLAATLKDCVYENLGYYKPLLRYFADKSRRSSS